MTIKQQKEAIKNCLTSLGWTKVNVKHLSTNPYSRTIKTFLVEFGISGHDNTFKYEILDFKTTISDVKSDNRVYLDIVNALNKALHGGK